MISDRDRRYLRYIVYAIALIQRRTSAGYAAFLADVDCQDAVLWRLETLAEAAMRLSQEIKDRHPEIPWRAIWGFRNVAAHAYLDIKLDDVWEIVEQHLAALDRAAQRELNDEPSDARG